MKTLPLVACILVLLTACGSDDSFTDYESLDADTSDATPSAPRTCAAHAVRWLREGNFWRVAWVNLRGHANIALAEGEVDVGSYTMRLEKPYTADGYTMFPITLSGQADERVVPRYTAIGSNRCGDIVGASKTIETIYSATTDTWTGNGLWGRVTPMKGQRVNSMAHSLIMAPSTYLKPPFIAIGESSTRTGVGAGTGCKFYPAYGTICGSDDPGNTVSNADVEYWSDTMGPIAYQTSSYDHGTRWVDDYETRMEVFFFADTSDASQQYELGTNTVSDATPVKFQNDLSSIIVVVPEGTLTTGTSADARTPAKAIGMQHWFSMEVSQAMSQKSLLVFLSWTHEATYEMSLFTAPSSQYGFAYATSGDPMPAEYLDKLDIAGASNLSGTYQPGKYLIGVRRTDGGTKGDASIVLSTGID